MYSTSKTKEPRIFLMDFLNHCILSNIGGVGLWQRSVLTECSCFILDPGLNAYDYLLIPEKFLH